MKKSKFTKLLAVILAISVVMASFGAVTAGASCAYPITGSDNAIKVIFADIVDTFMRFFTNMFAGLFGNGPGFVPENQPETDAKLSANYYEGIGKNFATAPEANAKWHMGYSNMSLIPQDYSNGTYYIGGYIAAANGFSNVVEGIAEIPGIGKDDMKVRSIAINDGTGKGTVLFATVDCIGLTNADIKDIRALLADFAVANNIKAINISATHSHSCIDTEGLWTKTMHKFVLNGLNNGLNGNEKPLQGTNPAYMAFLKETVAASLKAAFADIRPGVLTFSRKDIGQEYFQNKNRPSSGEIIYEIDGKGNSVRTEKTKVAMSEINRFIFTPDDSNYRPTMMLNMAAHPDVAGLPTDTNSGREISGDYIFYCGKFLENNGYNFMFWQGAIAGVYMNRDASNDAVKMTKRVEQSQRYGYEIARMALSLNLTAEDIDADAELSNREEIEANKNNPGYTTWYENWTPVDEEVVAPYLNLLLRQVEVPVSNGIVETIGKLNLANYVVIEKENGTYATVVEIGYMEMGSQFKVAFVPGEICQDLVAPNGKSVFTKDGIVAPYAITAQVFKAPTLCNIFGDDIMCFGLMNDSVGNIVPDNDFTMGDPVNHYQDLISLSDKIGSSLMLGFTYLSAEIVYA